MRSALRLIPLVAAGALAAFVLAGPLTSLYKSNAAASRPQPSASVNPVTSPTSCPASLPMPKTAGSPPATAALSFPYPIWVNDPLGVNLRSAPSASSTRIATLTQGTQANATSRATDATGHVWYRAAVGSQSGWVRSDFVTATPLQPASGAGWSLMLPQGYSIAPDSNQALTNVVKSGDDLPFLIIQTSTSTTLTVQLPNLVRADVAPVADHTATIQVWNYTVNEQVSRVALDTCKVVSAWARHDQGWPYETSVYVHTSSRSYDFTFFSPDPNSALVNQVLNSIALS